MVQYLILNCGIQGDDLVEFHRAAVLGLQICGDDSSTTSLPRDLLGISPNLMSSNHHSQAQYAAQHQHQHQPLQSSATELGIDQGKSNGK